MNILYIGQYSQGTTSKMRADILKDLLPSYDFHVIDTNVPFQNSNKLVRSIGFRFKSGPLINRINSFIINSLIKFGANKEYDIVWIDKGIFLTGNTLKNLRIHADKLVHFTPDMAFYKNKSLKFERLINEYDFVITTKTMEIGKYLKLIPKSKLIITTQGFSKAIHHPKNTFEEKDGTVAFIGKAETHRFEVVQYLINNQVKVKIAGKGWNGFVEKNKSNNFLNYIGEGLFSEEYSKFISSALFGLGALSKEFPELHTTRTFEIPACGTALLTERNQEISNYFDDTNAIFYENLEDLLYKINYYQDNMDLLKLLSLKGYDNVIKNGFDYNTIIKGIIEVVLGKTDIR